MPRLMEWPQAWYQFASGSFTLTSKNLLSQNPFTQRLSVSGPTSQFFQVKVQISDRDESVWMGMEGFFAEAGGSAGIIRISDFSRLTPQFNRDVSGRSPWSDGTFWADGTGWQNGRLPAFITVAEAAPKGATSVVVTGLPLSTARVLRRGDDVEFRRNGIPDETPSLHRIIRDAPTDALGRTRIEFRPGLRKAVALGDMVVLDYPMGNFRLTDDSQAVVERTPPNFGDLGFQLIEALI